MRQRLTGDEVYKDKRIIINQMRSSVQMMKMKAERTVGLNTKLRIQLLPFGTDMVGIKAIKSFQQLTRFKRV
jgi:hypothetical protein